MILKNFLTFFKKIKLVYNYICVKFNYFNTNPFQKPIFIPLYFRLLNTSLYFTIMFKSLITKTLIFSLFENLRAKYKIN